MMTNIIQCIEELVKSKKVIFVLLVFLLITFLYFSVPITIFPDSVQYYSYQKILNGLAPLSSWDVIRGPSFPVTIFIFISTIGSTMVGILMCTYLFFVGMLAVFYRALGRIMQDIKLDGPTKKIAIICFFGLIVFNPIIFGYYHTFLTEFIASFLALTLCLLAWRWMKVDYIAGQKAKFLMYVFLFAAMSVYVWFLKQPYITITLFPLLFASCLSIIKRPTLQNITQRVGVVLVSVACLGGGIVGWRAFLAANGVSDKTTSSADNYYLSGGIIKGLSDTSLSGLLVDSGKVAGYKLLSRPEQDRITKELAEKSGKNDGGVRILSVMSKSGVVIDEIPVYQERAELAVKDSIFAWTALVTRHPIVAVSSYSSNYLAAIDFYGYSTDPINGTLKPIRQLGVYGHENHSIGMAYANAPANMDIWTLKQISYSGLEYVENKPNIVKKIVSKVIYPFHQGVFMVLFLLLPFMLVYSIFKYRALRKNDVKKRATVQVYELIVILFGFSFLHALFNVVLGAMLDRYLFTAFPEVALGFILLIITNDRFNKIVNGVWEKYGKK